MKILFWNTNRNKDINNYLSSIIRDNDIDVFVVAEYVADKSELNKLFKDYYKKYLNP